MAGKHLVTWLVERQNGRGNPEFAAELGIHRTNWYRLREGIRAANLTDLGRAIDRYPEHCSSICAVWHKPDA